MKFRLTDIYDEIYELSDVYSAVINKEDGVPADDLVVVFPSHYNLPELKTISAYIGDEIVFEGIIDEQEVNCGKDGCFLKITARSLGAYLVDNEALPQTYYKPSLNTIFEKHIKPYGFTELKGNQKIFTGKFVVNKGLSEWDVFKNFCSSFLNTVPRITSDGIVDASGRPSDKNEVALKNSPGYLMYSSIKSNIKRYSLISEVFVSSKKSGKFDVRVCDENLILKAVSRKRYLNAANAVLTPVSCGETLIKNGKKDAFIIKAVCVNPIAFEIGQRISISDPIVGEISGLLIYKIKYSLDSSGQKAEISMLREEV